MTISQQTPEFRSIGEHRYILLNEHENVYNITDLGFSREQKL